MEYQGIRKQFVLALCGVWACSCATTSLLKAEEPVEAEESMKAPELQAVRNFIQEMGNEVIQKLTDNQLSDHDRFRAFKDILLKDFDVPGIASYLVGKDNIGGWNESDQTGYYSLLTDYVVKLYLGNFEPYRNAHVQLTVGRVVSRGRGVFSVKTKIERKDEPTLHVEWRVCFVSGVPKISDVVIEGMSMVQTKKQEFQSILRKGGVKALLEKLRRHVP